MNLRVWIKWKVGWTLKATQRSKWKVKTFETNHQEIKESWSWPGTRNQKADESKRNLVNSWIVKRKD